MSAKTNLYRFNLGLTTSGAPRDVSRKRDLEATSRDRVPPMVLGHLQIPKHTLHRPPRPTPGAIRGWFGESTARCNRAFADRLLALSAAGRLSFYCADRGTQGA